MDFLVQPMGPMRLGDWLNSNLNGDWTLFRAAVAFVKRSGTKHIAAHLKKFADSKSVELIVGIDHQGTSYEGLRELLDAVLPNGRIVVFHNRLPYTFHPKVYLFKSPRRAEVLVGSGNLTQGGLYTNYEAGILASLDLNDAQGRGWLTSIEHILDAWADEHGETSADLNHSLLEALLQDGYVLNESELAKKSSVKHSLRHADKLSNRGDVAVYFDAVAVPPAPAALLPTNVMDAASPVFGQRFAMTLQNTDVSVGQTTPGTSRRSPEVFVPLKARDARPDFWNWKDGFQEDPDRPGKYDRRGVKMRVGATVVAVNMMTWPVKSDFRLRSNALRSLGRVGDILVIEKVDEAGFEYDVSVVTTDSPDYTAMLSKCGQSVRNSKKRFGYF